MPVVMPVRCAPTSVSTPALAMFHVKRPRRGKSPDEPQRSVSGQSDERGFGTQADGVEPLPMLESTSVNQRLMST